MNRGKVWSIEDDTFLYRNFETRNLKDLAEYLQRTQYAIRLRWNDLNNPSHYASIRMKNSGNENAIQRCFQCSCSPDTTWKNSKAFEQHKRNSTHIIHMLKSEIKELRIKLEKLERRKSKQHDDEFHDAISAID